VAELRGGDGRPEAARELGRALHTLKGDAALVGMPEISAALHAAEDRAAEGAWDALAEALDAIARELAREGGEPGPAGAPAAAPAAPPGTIPPPRPQPDERWVRLQARVIDELAERLLEVSAAYGKLGAGLVEAVRLAPTPALRVLAEEAEAARRQLDDAVGAAWALRLVSVEELLRRLADHALELARAQGKPLGVRVDGGGAELERSTLDALEQPLLHLIRNAIDHGVEEPGARGGKPAAAMLVLEARAAGGAVQIVVEDDGRGIDPAVVRAAAVERGLARYEEAAALSDEAALELVFQFGVSTRRTATELSGRGVGLDAVRTRVEALGGEVRLASRPPHGARFVLAVPAAIARERAVVVEAGGGMFALPSRSVTALIRLGDHPQRDVAGGRAVQLGEAWAPLRGLDEVLGLPAGPAARDDAPALLLEVHGRRHAFAVDRIDGEHDLLRRPADPLIGRRGLVTASSVLDDGRVALWPSVPALLRGRSLRTGRGTLPPPARRRRRVLVVDDSAVVRELVASILRTAELLPETAGDGEAAWRTLEQGPPDLVLTDVEMPRLDGFGLLRRIRERWPRLPVVMLTTRGSEDDRRRAVALGADAYLVKSAFEEARLVETVRRLIEGPA
ncbi:MAG TPA: response regulator, partial [Kofleriaceae bacterium]|nr:response regulator [Kofleriaceae bacterium]